MNNNKANNSFKYFTHLIGKADWSIILCLISVAFIPVRRSKRGICYGNVAGWVGGWLSVTWRYCIKTAKPILKRFDHLVAPSF